MTETTGPGILDVARLWLDGIRAWELYTHLGSEMVAHRAFDDAQIAKAEVLRRLAALGRSDTATTGTPITYNPDGTIRNGHHRAFALAKSVGHRNPRTRGDVEAALAARAALPKEH